MACLGCVDEKVGHAMANRALLSRDVLLDLLRLHEELLADVAALLKEHGVTAPQYNVLRILRGAGPGGLTGTGIAAQMITRVPDVTRLVDRLEASGLVRRERCREDRRVVHVRLEPAGLALLARLDAPVTALHEDSLRGMPLKDLESLGGLLRRALSSRKD
jgi:DNA-binding MarR family transcriptional regulator